MNTWCSIPPLFPFFSQVDKKVFRPPQTLYADPGYVAFFLFP